MGTPCPPTGHTGCRCMFNAYMLNEHICEAPVNQFILDFESHIQLGPTYAAELLGIAYSTYAPVRAGRRKLQVYLQRHIQAVMMLPPEKLQDLIEEHVRAR